MISNEKASAEKNKIGEKLKIIACLACIIVIGLSLAGCGSEESLQPVPDTPNTTRHGGTLKISQQYESVSPGYPPTLLRAGTNRAAQPAIETLLRIDDSGQVIPWLATDFSSNADAKEIILKLREGVKFHDGTPFNAEAAIWNLQKQKSANTSGTARIQSFDMIDEYTLRANLSEWDSTVLTNFALTLGMMVSPTAYEQNGEEWAKNNPVGTGPFRFVSWELDQSLKYEKFDEYWQEGKPYLDAIEFVPVPDSQTRLMSFKAKEFDIAVLIDPQARDGLEKEGFIVLSRMAGSGALNLVPDSANPDSPWADLRVRQAAQHAIDTKAITDSIFVGIHKPSNQWIYEGHWGYNPDVVGYSYNPEKAKQLLEEAGYANGFNTKLLYRPTLEYELVMTAVQSYLKTVGINVELEPTETGRYDEIAFQGGGWEGLLHGTFTSDPDVTAALAHRYAGGNFFSKMLLPTDYAEAIQNAVNAEDMDSKQKYTWEAMKLMIDEYCLVTILYCVSDTAVTQPYVHNSGFMESALTSQWTPEEVWIDR